MKPLLLSLLIAIFIWPVAYSQETPPNYDEAKVPNWPLPNPLLSRDGKKIRNAKSWQQKRRLELLGLFSGQMFGRTPSAKPEVSYQVLKEDAPTLMHEGTPVQARRQQIRLTFRHEGRSLEADVLLYLPAPQDRAYPLIMGLNFAGNQATTPDTAVLLSRSWQRPGHEIGEQDQKRGTNSRRWPYAMAVSQGYAVMTAYYGDFDPDFDDGFANGVHGLMDGPSAQRDPDAWGSIAAWAWGLSRMADYAQTHPGIDGSKMAVLGHSRLGKAALWAGATDERFGVVYSNNSGCGGAALSRRQFGETVAIINRNFPHWFCQAFKQYGNREDQLPFDQHELMALVAPRALYVASATEDLWADPQGEFLALQNALPVYRLLKTDASLPGERPQPNQPFYGGRTGYHIREGKHDIVAQDWKAFLDFAGQVWKGK